MTETTTLTVFQQMVNRIGTGDPNRAILSLLDRIERLEGEIAVLRLPVPVAPVEKAEEFEPKKMGRPKGSKNKA